MSALDVVIQAGYLPHYAGPVEFAAWLRQPVDEVAGDFEATVAAAVTAAITPTLDAAAASIATANAAVADAETARDAALAAQAAAEDALAAMEALVLTFEKASVANILVGTDDAKYITSLGNKTAMAWYAITTGYASPYAIDWDNGLNQALTINKATVLNTPLHPADGQTYGIKLAWTGVYDLTLPTNFDFGTNNDGSSFSPSYNKAADKIDYLWATWDATAAKYRVQFSRSA
ncbi:hypothetical protein Kuura_013 [Caulobacter phage Kuura]|nr:hypothetical protein Kuura_013 [Caulobacter phage Kuura]